MFGAPLSLSDNARTRTYAHAHMHTHTHSHTHIHTHAHRRDHMLDSAAMFLAKSFVVFKHRLVSGSECPWVGAKVDFDGQRLQGLVSAPDLECGAQVQGQALGNE